MNLVPTADYYMAILSIDTVFELWQLARESSATYWCSRGGFEPAIFWTWVRFLIPQIKLK